MNYAIIPPSCKSVCQSKAVHGAIALLVRPVRFQDDGVYELKMFYFGESKLLIFNSLLTFMT